MVTNAANSYTGPTNISGGTLAVGSLANGGLPSCIGQSASAAANLLLGNGATLIYTGTATLGGTGPIGGTLTVANGGTIAPGASIGTFTALGNAAIAGTYVCEVNGADVDTLAVTGNLDLTGSSLAITPVGGGATQSGYVIATYGGTLTGTFPVSTVLPAGYSLDYTTPHQIKLVATGTPYDTFVSVIANPANRDPGDDPDADGIPNAIEFVIGGNPASVNDDALLPTATLVTTDVGNGVNNYVRFTFRRTTASAYLAPGAVYHANLLAPWTAALGAPGVVITTDHAIETGVDQMNVYLPRSLAAAGKLFARLQVVMP